MNLDHPLQIRLDLPAEPVALNLARGCLGLVLEQAYDPKLAAEEVYKLQLALHEIMINIIRHAYDGQAGGRIAVSLNLLPDQIIIELQDTGASFDIDQAPEPDLDNLQEGGYGLFLARSLTDELIYQPHPGNNHWRLVKQLSGK